MQFIAELTITDEDSSSLKFQAEYYDLGNGWGKSITVDFGGRMNPLTGRTFPGTLNNTELKTHAVRVTDRGEIIMPFNLKFQPQIIIDRHPCYRLRVPMPLPVFVMERIAIE